MKRFSPAEMAINFNIFDPLMENKISATRLVFQILASFAKLELKLAKKLFQPNKFSQFTNAMAIY